MSGKSVIIAGGGIIGLALAWRLLELGARVTVIDAGKAAPAATLAAAGMLAPSFERGRGAVAEPLFEFSLKSLNRWKDFASKLEAASGLDVDYRPFGVLGAAFDGAGAMALADDASAIGVRSGNARWLSASAARIREPLLAEDVAAALWAPDDGQVDPRRVLIALSRVIRKAGGVIVEDRAATVMVAHGAVSGLRTADDFVHQADAVVIAAGAASQSIEHDAPPPPVFPVKGEAVALKAGETNLKSVVRAPGAYLCPKAGGRLVIGATEIAHEASLDVSPAAIDGLKSAAARAAPFVEGLPETERWAGLRPATPDGAPIIGRDPRGPEGLYFALGHYRNGVLLAPETAAVLAEEIINGPKPRVLAAFRPDRF